MRFFLLFSLSLVTLFACNKDDDDSGSDGDITGTWMLEAQSTMTTTDLGGASTTSILTYESGDVVVTFNDDGTFSQTGIGTYRQLSVSSGDTLLNTTTQVDLNSSGTYSLSNGQVVGFGVTMSNTPQTDPSNTTITYNRSDDVLTFDVDGTVENMLGGQTVTGTVTGESRYRMQ